MESWGDCKDCTKYANSSPLTLPPCEFLSSLKSQKIQPSPQPFLTGPTGRAPAALPGARLLLAFAPAFATMEA